MRKLLLALGLALILAAGGAAVVTFTTHPAMAGCTNGGC
jgi:hypothetical protein